MKPPIKSTVLLFVILGLSGLPGSAAPAFRVVKSNRANPSLLRNGGFEEVREGKPVSWNSWSEGFRLAPGAGRSNSVAVLCDNPGGKHELGVGQNITLRQTSAAPLVVRGWSRCEGMSGSADSGYALYADLVYDDGTTLWGQTAPFRCGTHDWESREFVIMPEKPVKSLTLYCLLRGHTGRAWFDDVSLEEIRSEEGAVLLQGMPVAVADVPPVPATAQPQILATEDGLELTVRGNVVQSLRVDGHELVAKTASGFLARDVAAGSDFCTFTGEACPELNLSLQARLVAQKDHIVIQGRVADTTRRDRAIQLLFALPVDATGWRWGDDIRRSRVIQGRGEFANTVGVRCGATGTLSVYPVGAVCGEQAGLALAFDMAKPAIYRVCYHAGTRQLLVAYDFGLAADTVHFPSAAEFQFVLYRFDPRWGFRAAFEKLMQVFPEQFAVRSKEQGIWMPFTDIRTVQGWQDFNFRYHEGNNNVPFDETNNILSFRYTEPMTWWMTMGADVARTPAEAIRIRDAQAQKPGDTLAKVAQVAGMTDASGEPCLMFREEPWCRGAVWSLNPNPRLPGQPNGATVHWGEAIKERLYGPKAKGQLDGEYLDSLEGYVTADLNYRREHFRETTAPLTFDAETRRPALYKGLAVFEFTKWMADDVHRLGKLMFANGVPYRYTFLCPWLDVMGTETDWMSGGKYQPVPESQLCLWRTLSGAKPYLLLMNTRFDAFTSDLVEKYFQHSLFYGFYPSMFSHNAADNPYWQNPAWYNRDRALFKKYQPIIKQVAEAGWHPITGARCANDRLLIERFGPDAKGTVYLTCFNDSAQPQRGELTPDPKLLPLTGQAVPTELLTGQFPARTGTGWPISLGPQEVAVFRVRP